MLMLLFAFFRNQYYKNYVEAGLKIENGIYKYSKDFEFTVSDKTVVNHKKKINLLNDHINSYKSPHLRERIRSNDYIGIVKLYTDLSLPTKFTNDRENLEFYNKYFDIRINFSFMNDSLVIKKIEISYPKFN